MEKKKLNKKHCSNDAYKQCEQILYLIFYHYFSIIIPISIIHKDPNP